MEELPRQETTRLLGLLEQDEGRRNRRDFIHSFEIIEKNWACPYSIWPMPNEDVLLVINNKAKYDSFPVEDSNEVQKGMLFLDLRQFIADNSGRGPMLCEAMGYKPCLRGKCPIFAEPGSKSGGEYGICREFKIAFKR